MAAPRGSLYFQENEILQTLESDLTEIFSTEEAISLFGTQVDVRSEYDDISEDLTFPCVLISFDTSSAVDIRATSSQPQQFTEFVLVFEVFSKGINDYTPTVATRLVSEYLIKNIQQKYSLLRMTSNRYLPNIDDSVSRKQVTFMGVINNETHMIYSN